MSVIKVSVTDGGTTTEYDETQIIINPTISKSICSGGYSVGNTACACLKVGIPYGIFGKGALVKIFYGDNQILGNYYIDSFEKCGCAKINPTDTYLTQMVMLTCYDSMSKLDDYASFETDMVTPADIYAGITAKTGLPFATNSDVGNSFEMPKADAESKTMREWLGVFGAYLGGNYIIHSYWLNNAYVEEITFIPIYYSGISFTALENTPVTVENSITFSKVVCRASETFKSGDDTSETLSIDCQYATQDSTDIIKFNIADEYYTAFKCDKAIINYVSLDIGDTFIPKGQTTGYKMYNLDLVISIKGLYLTCGADVFKKKINDSPQIKKSDELKAITDFAVTVSNGIATFTWKNPTSNFTGAILKRKAATDFNNIFEGETIYIGNGKTFSDTLPNNYTTYYYRILSYYGDNYNADCDGLSVLATDTPPDITVLFENGDENIGITGGWNYIENTAAIFPKTNEFIKMSYLPSDSTYKCTLINLKPINLAGKTLHINVDLKNILNNSAVEIIGRIGNRANYSESILQYGQNPPFTIANSNTSQMFSYSFAENSATNIIEIVFYINNNTQNDILQGFNITKIWLEPTKTT